MTNTVHPIHWLRHADQHLGLLPTLGGAVAVWQLDRPQGPIDLWRPWDGRKPDLYSVASFPLLPWSNRISAGGFTHAGVFYPVAPNRAGEPYPIHGDGWLQPWSIYQPFADTLEMTLESAQLEGNPYAYRALQRFVLRDGCMDQTLTVTHTGAQALPYGLGQHPHFLRCATTRLHTQVQGVWLSGADPLPTEHTHTFPPSWDPRQGMDVNGTLVDNAYTGWSGQATIAWPEHQLELSIRVPEVHDQGRNDGYCLLYRPPAGPAFCFEPVTHPIDAFHAPDTPGLRLLNTGESLTLQVEWRFKPLKYVPRDSRS